MGLIAALATLSACGDRPAPAAEEAAGLPEPSGPPIVQQVQRQEQPLQKSSPGVRWESKAAAGGQALVLLNPDGTLRLSIACISEPRRLVVHVPSFSAIGSEDRFALGLGNEPVTLVADPVRAKPGEGVTAEAPVPPDLKKLLAGAGPLSALYGTQRIGPHDPPPPELSAALGAACARVSG